MQQIESGRTVLNFKEIPNLNLKGRYFAYKKKKRLDDASSGHYSLSSSFFSEKTGSVNYFTGAFNVPNIHQIFQPLHETNHQTTLYVWVWSSPAHWQLNERGITP